MRTLYHKLISVLFLFIFSSCANQIIPYLSIENIDFKDDYIRISLTNTPNQNKCIEAIKIYKDDSEMKGSFYFDDKNINFYPYEEIQEKHDYLVEISTELEDIDGHSLKHSYIYKYSTKSESIPPYIISVTPENESEIIQSDVSINIDFSEPVNEQSFSKAFSISPSVPFLCIWENNYSSVKLEFEKELTKNTIYTLTITKSLTDTQNNNLRADYKTNFNYFPSTNNPFEYKVFYIDENETELTDDIKTELYADTSFRIDFSNEVSIDSISSYISFYPELRVTYIPDWENKNSIEIKLNEVPEWDRTYTFTINNGFSDEFSQKMEDKKEFSIIFSKEKNRPVEFIKAFFSTKNNANEEGDFFPITSKNVFEDLCIPVESFKTDEYGQTEYATKDLNLYCIFRISKEAQNLFIPSILTGVKISPSNSCLSVMIENCHFYTQSEYTNSPIGNIQFTDEDYSDWNLAVVCFDLTVTVYRANGTIKFTFDDSISDNLGNKMNKSLIFEYNKS